MRLHTTFITFNRIECTKVAVASYLETVSVPYSYVIVDNASSDGTQEWLAESDHPYLLLDKNYYPGYATNRGWELAPPDADYFQRADNDNGFLPGWCEHAIECFAAEPNLGQLGLRTDEVDEYSPMNPAGDSIIPRELWEQGLRWEELPWGNYGQGCAESLPFARAVSGLGYSWGRATKTCIEPLAEDDPDDPYCIESWRVRGILAWALERHGFGRRQIRRRVRRAG